MMYEKVFDRLGISIIRTHPDHDMYVIGFWHLFVIAFWPDTWRWDFTIARGEDTE